MRRHIGTFCHVARIAQVAAVDDLAEAAFLHAVEFAGLALVDQVEEVWKRRAQIDAAAAAVTDIEHAREFGHDLGFVIEFGLLPAQRVAGRRFQAAFAHGHAFTGMNRKKRAKDAMVFRPGTAVP